MNWYNLIFFHVFKRYYKNGRYKNDIPWLTASGIIGSSSLLWLLTIYTTVTFLIKGETPGINKKYFVPFGVTFIILHWFWFINRKRYLKIFSDFYKVYTDNKLTEIFSWLYILGAYLAFVLMLVTLKM
jgi:hypothetical protein